MKHMASSARSVCAAVAEASPPMSSALSMHDAPARSKKARHTTRWQGRLSIGRRLTSRRSPPRGQCSFAGLCADVLNSSLGSGNAALALFGWAAMGSATQNACRFGSQVGRSFAVGLSGLPCPLPNPSLQPTPNGAAERNR